jgi:hypothetical protein
LYVIGFGSRVKIYVKVTINFLRCPNLTNICDVGFVFYGRQNSRFLMQRGTVNRIRPAAATDACMLHACRAIDSQNGNWQFDANVR